MFVIDKIEDNKDDGSTTVTLSLDAGNGIVVESRWFVDKAAATRWINYMKGQYFTLKFEKWVKHLQIIQQHGQPQFYHTERRIKAFEKLTAFNWAIVKDPPITKLSDMILDIEDSLREVLPMSTNPSYGSSLKTMEGFLLFAKRHATAQPAQTS